MLFFGKGKKNKQEKNTASCSCQCACSKPDINEAQANTACCVNEGKTTGTIKVLGTGCPSCHALLENTKEAVKMTGILTEVEYVTDMPEIIKYGVMSLPALVVNEKVVSMGKVLKPADIEKLLRK